MQTLSLDRATRRIRGNSRTQVKSTPYLERILPRIPGSAVVLAAELALSAAAYLISSWLVSSAAETSWWNAPLIGIGIAVVSGLVGTLFSGLYNRSFRYANLLDIRALGQAIVLNGLCIAALTYRQAYGRRDFGLILTDTAFLAIFWGALHFSSRLWQAHAASTRKDGARVIVVGAGDAGLAVLKELSLDPNSRRRPIALADDDPRKLGRSFYGVPVLGGTGDLMRIASEKGAEEILVCIPSATRSQMREILGACRSLDLPVRSLPSLHELLLGRANKISPRDLRAPRIEYLLQKDAVRVDGGEFRRFLEGKKILVTGAGGSIGSELARQIAKGRPRQLLLADKSENSLFYVHLELSDRMDAKRVKPILTDLSLNGRAWKIMREERPDVVFHAAAYKHVSMVELHPQEAIRNNVLGTRNLAEAALECGVEAFVNVSTDKAVDPHNFMGLSKKIAELCIQECSRQALARRDATRFASVRFGNVAGSTGSVIRLFAEQIERGGPIRVTHPQASRYFMSLTEAVQLILSAAELARRGETFIFQMGEPFNIYELAKTMALFSGLRPHRDIEIEFIGLRPGEKLCETLWEEWEHPVASSSGQILAIREHDPLSNEILAATRQMEELLAHDDADGLVSCIGELFPAFAARRASRTPAPTSLRTPELDVAQSVEVA